MVKEVQKDNKVEYVCEACAYRYATRELAGQCEEWCTEHHSCNLEITAQGMPPKENT